MAKSKRNFNVSSETEKDLSVIIDSKYQLRKSAEKQSMRYNLINGGKELVPRNRSYGRYDFIPKMRKYETNISKFKPEFLQAISENPSIFRRQNGENTNFADEQSLMKSISRTSISPTQSSKLLGYK